jgi:hypothetical protein
MSLPAALRNLRKTPGVKAQWRAVVADDVFSPPSKTWRPAGAGVETVERQPPCTDHQKEPMQAKRTLPQHRTWTAISYILNKEEARDGEHRARAYGGQGARGA